MWPVFTKWVDQPSAQLEPVFNTQFRIFLYSWVFFWSGSTFNLYTLAPHEPAPRGYPRVQLTRPECCTCGRPHAAAGGGALLVAQKQLPCALVRGDLSSLLALVRTWWVKRLPFSGALTGQTLSTCGRQLLSYEYSSLRNGEWLWRSFPVNWSCPRLMLPVP